MSSKNLPLGRGLAALLGDIQLAKTNETTPNIKVTMLPITEIVRGSWQPRLHFDETGIDELARSIQQHGLIQPITVRAHGEHYEIVAGERRWRACLKLQLLSIPCLVIHATDEQALAIALIENLQRQELNPIEEAQALQRLLEEFSLNHQQISEILGQSRAHITNQLRLLNLEPEVKNLLIKKFISPGHARCLLGLEPHTQLELAEKIYQQQWSVRQTEQWLQNHKQHKTYPPKTVAPYQDLLAQVKQKWPTQFKINAKTHEQGKLTIHYQSSEDLNAILQHLLEH